LRFIIINLWIKCERDQVFFFKKQNKQTNKLYYKKRVEYSMLDYICYYFC
jgi:hypothetical protein